jgi:hypothetical protein
MRQVLVALAAAAVLAGCGSAVRVAYNNGDVAMRFMAHEYLDLHGEQSDQLKAQLARFHVWHRREELPRYAALFGGASGRLATGLERADVTWAIAQVRERYRATMEQAAEELAPVVATLRADNLAALERKLAEGNEKFAREFLEGGAARQARARAKRLSGWFDEWLGSVTPEQAALIERFAATQPQLDQMRFEDRQRRQREFVQILGAHGRAPDLAARLRDFLVHWERDRGAEHRRAARDWEERLVALILEVDRSLTPKQRDHVVRRFAFFAEEARILARQGQPAGTTAGAPFGAAVAAQ